MSEYVFIWNSVWCFLILLFIEVHLKNVYINREIQEGYEYSKGCANLHCENGSRCIKQRSWCKNPPCPGMLYCAKSREEAVRGPSTCNTVRCNKGHICVVHVRGCSWNENCKQQIARCISQKEYYEGPTSCAGFKCPLGKHCILRESYCIKPPCKLLKSCTEIKDVQIWFEKCRMLNCPSEYECFLRKPEKDCLNSSCIHTPECMFTTEDELITSYCHGWICPRTEKCIVQIVGKCKGFNCTVERWCSNPLNTSSTSFVTSAFTNGKSALTSTITASQTSRKPITEIPTIQQQIVSTLITEPMGSSPNEASSSTDRKIEPTMSYNTTRLEVLKKIYVINDGALPFPMLLKGINFVGQSYPIWIRNELHHAMPLQVNNKNIDEWGFPALQEPYGILLPPYEPVILADGQYFPFLPYPLFSRPLDHIFNGTVSPFKDVIGINLKQDYISTIITDKNNKDINSSTEDFKVNHFVNISVNFFTTEETNTVSSGIRYKEHNYSNNYEEPWYTYDYPEGNESLIHQQEVGSSVEYTTDDTYHGTLIKTRKSMKTQATNESRDHVSETPYTNSSYIDKYTMIYRDNKNTMKSVDSQTSFSTEQKDHILQDEEYDSLVNYPFDMIPIHNVDKSRRLYQNSLDKILQILSNTNGNQRGAPITLSFGKFGKRKNELSVTPFLYTTSHYHVYDNKKKDGDQYNEYYYDDDYYAITTI